MQARGRFDFVLLPVFVRLRFLHRRFHLDDIVEFPSRPPFANPKESFHGGFRPPTS